MHTLHHRSAHQLPMAASHYSTPRPIGFNDSHILFDPGPLVANGMHTLSHQPFGGQLQPDIIPPLGALVANGALTLFHRAAHRWSTAAIHYSTPRPIGSQR